MIRMERDRVNAAVKDSFSDTVFLQHENTDCLIGRDLDFMTVTSDVEPCKEWCARNETCGGFTLWDSYCYFKLLECKDDLRSKPAGVLYLKETVLR